MKSLLNAAHFAKDALNKSGMAGRIATEA